MPTVAAEPVPVAAFRVIPGFELDPRFKYDIAILSCNFRQLIDASRVSIVLSHAYRIPLRSEKRRSHCERSRVWRYRPAFRFGRTIQRPSRPGNTS
jgi:hypothetical protein